jgi:hypothetical protein
MTNMPASQHPVPAPAAREPDVDVADVIDLIVPPPRSRWWSAGVLAVAGAALAVLLALPPRGLVHPRLEMHWTSACGGACPDGAPVGTELVVRNAGWLGADVTAIDARAAGLGRPTVRVRRPAGAPAGPDAQPAVFPFHLDPGETAQVYLAFDRYDCGALDLDPTMVLPVDARGPLGLPVSVGVMPGEFTRPAPDGIRSFPAGRDPLAISWSAGITWHLCHPT